MGATGIVCLCANVRNWLGGPKKEPRWNAVRARGEAEFGIQKWGRARRKW
jgi:hypothetical protein